MMVAGVVGVPGFFILVLTISNSQDTFSNLGSVLDQVASYQFIGAIDPFLLFLCTCILDRWFASPSALGKARQSL
jgi:hypothetical protein